MLAISAMYVWQEKNSGAKITGVKNGFLKETSNHTLIFCEVCSKLNYWYNDFVMDSNIFTYSH